MSEEHRRLRREVDRQADRLRRADRERDTVLAQTAFLGTLGLLLVLPIVVGAYVGQWLDQRLAGYSVHWTVSCVLLGVAVGAYSVYLFVRSRQ